MSPLPAVGGRLVAWAAVLLLALLGGLMWWLGTAPVPLLVASYVAVLTLLSRTLPVRIAVSAALVVQLAVYLVLVLAAPLLVGGPMRPGIALAILLSPCLAVAPDLWAGRRSRRREPPPADLPARPWRGLAAAGLGAVVVVATVAAAEVMNRFGAAAWSASGDARLHTLFTRQILQEGGLHGRPLRYQPEFQEALVALLSNTHGRGVLAPGPLLESDLRSLGLVSCALAVVWTLAVGAMLVGLGPAGGAPRWPAVAVGSLLPLTGLGLGVLLRDGFTPILLLVPLLTCALTVLSWLVASEEAGTATTVAVAVSATALPVLAFTWTPFFGVAAITSAVVWLHLLRGRSRHRAARLAAMVVGGGAGSAYCIYVLTRSDFFVAIPGAIAAPSPATAVAVVAVVALVALAGWSAVPLGAWTPWLVGGLAAVGITVYAVVVQPPGLAWNYFPSKVAWIWVLVSAPLLLLPFAHPRVTTARGLGVAGPVAVLLGVTAISPVASPVLPQSLAWLQSGRAPAATITQWTQSDADSLHLAVRLGHPRTRYVVYRVEPEQDRLTNFWLALYDPLGDLDSEFIPWGYRETGTLADVCELLALEPHRVVATAAPDARRELRDGCGRAVRVRLVPGPSEDQG